MGNGSPYFAAAFREDLGLDGPLLVDPELRAYRAAGLRRGRVEVLSPRLLGNAARALREGHRQDGVQGDAWQLGGVFVIRPDGALTFRHVSAVAGDHPSVDDILAGLDPDAEPLAESAAPSRLQLAASRALSRIVDPLVVPSFDRTGFRIHALGFDPTDLDVDLSGKRCLVTGANAGLGFETARGLADLGAEVVMVCRSAERGEAAADAIREQTGNARVSVVRLDVSDLDAIRHVAPALGSAPVDVLVHNAGLLPLERTESPQGLEITLATHVVGPFLLTSLLRPALEAAEAARVIWVSSGGMYARRLNLDDPNWEQREPYDGVVAYAETKRAQVVLAELWADALRDTSIVVNAMHPGWADTGGVRHSLPAFHRLTRAVLRTPAEGADTIVWLAASQRGGEVSGQFFFDRVPRSPYRLPFTRESAVDRESLWRRCGAWSAETTAARAAP